MNTILAAAVVLAQFVTGDHMAVAQPQPPTVERIVAMLCRHLAERRTSIRLDTEGGWQAVEPYLIGYDWRGDPFLFGWYVASGWSSIQGWRPYRLDRVRRYDLEGGWRIGEFRIGERLTASRGGDCAMTGIHSAHATRGRRAQRANAG